MGYIFVWNLSGMWLVCVRVSLSWRKSYTEYMYSPELNRSPTNWVSGAERTHYDAAWLQLWSILIKPFYWLEKLLATNFKLITKSIKRIFVINHPNLYILWFNVNVNESIKWVANYVELVMSVMLSVEFEASIDCNYGFDSAFFIQYVELIWI